MVSTRVNFNKTIIPYIQKVKSKAESSKAKTPQQPSHQQDHSHPRNSQEIDDQQTTDSTVVVDRDTTIPSSLSTPSSSQADKKGKKRVSSQKDEIDYLFNPPKRPSTATTRSFSEFLVGQQHDGNAIHEKNHIVIIKDNRTHRINSPSNMLESPHRPKVEPATIEGISEYVVMAGSSIACSNQTVQEKYEQNKIDQKNNSSLEAFPCIKDFLKTVLSIPFEDFPRILWSTSINTDDEKSVMMMKIIQYTLHHSIYIDEITPTEETSHERTFFVHLIIPVFRALEKATGLKLGSESSNKNGQRLMDGLALTCGTPSKMESVLMEASSELLKCPTNSLLVESKNYQDASYEAFKNLEVNTVHTIKNEITLHQVSVLESFLWQSIQVRTYILVRGKICFGETWQSTQWLIPI
ncbi:hypothetical protein INT45_000246 [Circinella minor]|uniref:Uncharacterized protein n=1 Tax=Circinella minor TaxID=1195481 RepID=A0A8H7S447_9FUNG|nr:hypothetical protein INT45_000246 [Circinella minor]